MRKIAVIILMAAALVFPQFGRNKVQYKNYDWYYLTTPDFVIYYPGGYEHLVEFARRELEKGLDQLSKDFSYTPQDRISIVIYPTRFDFQETNITPTILPEGVGGFTETLKNRVVVPFNGNWEDFRHVLVHELTHAFTFEFLYGSAPAGVLSLNRVFRIPLWLAEGTSEFESLEWDPQADMFMRDAVLNDYIAHPDELGGYLVYKQGQSMMYYIAQRWGRKKIGEIFAKGKIEVSIDRVLKSALGEGIDDFYHDWQLWVRRRYFPQIEGHSFPLEVATKLTDHRKDKSNANLQPVYNPTKDQIAFISDRADYMDIYLIDVPTGFVRRIERGERSGSAQSFHPMDSRMSFSADGRFLVHSVKVGGKDGIAIVDVSAGKRVRTIVFDTLDIREISSPFITRSGRIFFAALHHGQRDIFAADSSGKNLVQITDDVYDDNYPAVSPDERFLVFSSDRPAPNAPKSIKFPSHYGRYNLFMMDFDDSSLCQLTYDGRDNKYPSFSPDGSKIAFTSARNGVANIYIYDLDADTLYPVTNLICAAYTPTWSPDGKKIAFAAFWYGGWDIFVLDNVKPMGDTLPVFETAFEGQREEQNLASAEEDSADLSSSDVPLVWGQLSKYRFSESDTEETEVVKKYHPQFSADYTMVNFGYSTYYGLEGASTIMLSDALANHQIIISTDLYQNLDNSNFYAAYGYLRHRADFYFTAFHYKNYFYDQYYRLFSDRYYGGHIYMFYPFSQFSRAELGAGFFAVDRYYYDPPYDDTYSENFPITAALVFDNSLWGFTGPLNGARRRIEFESIPPVGRNPTSYWAAEIDLRQYYHFGRGYSFAFRIAGAYSGGKYPKKYYLGGVNQWLNYSVARTDIYSISDIYISEIAEPLRGYDYFQFVGNAYALLNMEFRYPFIKYLDLGFPPVTVRGINGALFADLGGVASPPYSNFCGMREGRLKDLKMGLGIGIRSWIWMFAFHYDLAWTTDLEHISPKPRAYLSLGLEF